MNSRAKLPIIVALITLSSLTGLSVWANESTAIRTNCKAQGEPGSPRPMPVTTLTDITYNTQAPPAFSFPNSNQLIDIAYPSSGSGPFPLVSTCRVAPGRVTSSIFACTRSP